MAGILFPQPNQDADAANFSQWAEGDTTSPYVVQGCDFKSINRSGSNPTVPIEGGKVRVRKDTFEATQKGIVREYGNEFVAVMDPYEITLSDSASNFVFVDPNFQMSGTSVPEFVVRTANNPPSTESVLIGVVDTTDDSVNKRNREPTVTYGESVTTVKSILPNYDEVDNAPAEAGSVVYITGAGNDGAGVYSYNEKVAQWDGPLEGGEHTADTHVSVSEDGTQLEQNPTDINFEENIVARADGDGSVSVGVAGDALGYSTVSITGAHTAATMEAILADASGGTFDVTLPAPSQDAQIVIHKTDDSGNTVGVQTDGAETINGQPDDDLSAQYESIEVISDGTDWYII